MTWKEQYDTREAIRIEAEEKARAEYRELKAAKYNKLSNTPMKKQLEKQILEIVQRFDDKNKLSGKKRGPVSVIYTKNVNKRMRYLSNKTGLSIHLRVDNLRDVEYQWMHYEMCNLGSGQPCYFYIETK